MPLLRSLTADNCRLSAIPVKIEFEVIYGKITEECAERAHGLRAQIHGTHRILLCGILVVASEIFIVARDMASPSEHKLN